ncbi:MAG: cell envelope integrity protein TolA [Gammaproteobacteria bacterium]|nr:MAG: cell envelope integrity protein TolA [Gammaproteobacteria bacterium]
MRLGWFTTLSSSVLSLILHLVVGVLLLFSFEFTPQPKTQIRQDVNVVQAVVIDKKQVDLELERIRKIEEEKHKKEKQRLEELEKKANNLEKKRKEEEKKLAEAKKKKEQEQKKLKEEQVRLKKLEKEKAELKKKRELEEKKIKEAEAKAEKLKAEDKARQQKIAEEKKVAENNRREKELADAMNAEETAKQASKDQELINRISNNIKRSIESKFNKVGLPDDLECELRVRLVPGGDVIDVTIAKSSGHDIFDRRAVNATQKASPLPVPDDVETFERLDLREIKLYFKPTN